MSCLTLSPKKRKKVTSYPKKKKKYNECGQPFSWVENVDDIAIFIIKKNLQAEIIINAINNTLKI